MNDEGHGAAIRSEDETRIRAFLRRYARGEYDSVLGYTLDGFIVALVGGIFLSVFADNYPELLDPERSRDLIATFAFPASIVMAIGAWRFPWLRSSSKLTFLGAGYFLRAWGGLWAFVVVSYMVGLVLSL